MRYVFPDEDALAVQIAAGAVPPEVLAAPARWARAAGGAILVDTSGEELGGRAATWLELIPPRAVRAWEPGRVVIFTAPSSDAAVGLAGELLRLGCDRLELAFGEPALVRAHDPPFFVVARAGDREGELRLFLPRGRVWVEAGYAHRFADGVTPPPGELVLIGGDGGWLRVADRFVDVRTIIDVALPPSRLLAAGAPRRLALRPRLARVRRGPPASLWVLREDAMATVDALVDSLPRDELARLAFACCDPLVILRARPLGPPPELELRGEAYAALPGLSGRYAPAGTVLEPPLGPATEQLFGAQPGEVAWLTDGLQVERVAEAAFVPLAEWVDVHIDRAKEALLAWVRGAWMEPQAGAEPARADARAASAAPGPARAEARARTATTIAAAPPPPAAAPPPEVQAAVAPPHPTPDARPDRRDAAVTFARDLWPLAWGDAGPLAAVWARTVAAGQSLAEPASLDALGAAALLVEAATRGARPDALQDLAGWIAARDDELDARSFWLVHAAVARLAGDPLWLARARDRLLARLSGGLTDRDVPIALAAADAPVAGQLDALLARVERVERRRSAVEAPPAWTLAYVRLTVAWGLARAGAPARARALARRAAAELDRGDPVHGALVTAYLARIDERGDGAAGIEALDGILRYKVDRLRQGSIILAPRERIDPVRRFHDPRAAETEELAGVPLDEAVGRLSRLPPARRALALESVLAMAAASGRDDLVGGIVDEIRELLPLVDDFGPLARGLRELRRLGLAAEAASLLEEMRGGGLSARLELAGSLCALGRVDEAEPIFAEARAALPGLLLAERPAVQRAFADAAGQAPGERALAQLGFLEGMLAATTDSYNTNSHFCLSVIQLVEALVAGHLAALDGRHLDAEEHAVRARVRRDLKEAGA